MKNEKHLSLSFFSLAETDVAHMIDLPSEWFAAQTISSDTKTPCILHLCCTATHCFRGVFFSFQNRRDEHQQCLPSWKCIPFGNPQHETNKYHHHNTLAIHSHLHGYVGCCQLTLCAMLINSCSSWIRPLHPPFEREPTLIWMTHLQCKTRSISNPACKPPLNLKYKTCFFKWQAVAVF